MAIRTSIAYEKLLEKYNDQINAVYRLIMQRVRQIKIAQTIFVLCQMSSGNCYHGHFCLKSHQFTCYANRIMMTMTRIQSMCLEA